MLTPYSGTFGPQEAKHLLRRATFGPSPDQVLEATSAGLTVTLETLFSADDLVIPPPTNQETTEDPNVPIGSTWISAPYLNGVNVNNYRLRSLKAWATERFFQEDTSIRPRLALFWQNHFSVIDNSDVRAYYSYLNLLWTNALGSFRQLVEDITVEPQMLRFLNGDSNRANSPNENYARELLELFTLGKGEQVGSGDYTTYTEDDVRAFSRALTGWRNRYFGSRDPDQQPESYFTERLHDATDKQLSPRLGGGVLTDGGAEEYKAVIDVVFNQADIGTYLCRKLYRWFVYYDITPEVEQNVIAPMVSLLRASNWEVGPVVKALLGSQHFFDLSREGALIKSPLDFVVPLVNRLQFEYGTDLYHRQWLFRKWFSYLQQQEMDTFRPASVAGWKAYYQSPQYNRMWVNASTLQLRKAITNQLVGNGVVFQGTRYKVDLLALIATFDDPAEPNALIAELIERFLPVGLPAEAITALKGVLIPGLPDFEWTVEYSDHLAHPDDQNLRDSVEVKVRNTLRAILSTAEAHLY